MSHRLRLAPALVAGLLLAMPAMAQTAAPAGAPQPAPQAAEGADLAGRLDAAYRLLGADRPGEAMAQLEALRSPLEESGDPALLIRFYDLMGYAGQEVKDRAIEIDGNAHSAILNYLVAPLDAPDTVLAEFTLADAYRGRDEQIYALAHVLAAARGARRAGSVSPDMEELEAKAAALMGQRLLRDERPELALMFLRRAGDLAGKGHIDADDVRKLDLLIAEAERGAAARRDLPPARPEDCTGHAGLAAEQMVACRRNADLAVARGDSALADAILARLLADVPRASLRADRYDAARDLLVVRLLHRQAGDPQLRASAELIANYLAYMGEVTPAALLGARAARIAIDGSSYDPELAQTCGHIALRALRAGAPDLARRMMALQRKVLLAGLAEAGAPLSAADPKVLQRRLSAALLRIESARIATGSHLPRLAAAQWAEVERQIATIDLAAFDTVERFTSVEYAGVEDFVFPSYAAALEFMGRLARRLPASDPRHDVARGAWVNAVEVWWGDSARADALADEAIREIRAAPQGRDEALVNLLSARSSIVAPTNPALSARLTREAYEIVAARPGEETRRIELLLDMALDQTDSSLVRALVAEAQKLREAGGAIGLSAQVRLDLKRAFIAFDDGETDLALRLGEGAIAHLVAAGKGDSWVMAAPARDLAGLYAALGRMDDARKTYETHVLARSNAMVDGEEKVLSDRLGLANLEAYYAPDDGTVRTLSTLLERARLRVRADRDLVPRILRAQAFAYHGLGDGERARLAARDALNAPRPPASETENAREDRKLLEALVGADWQGSRAAVKP
ncbi:hypothetical protein V5F59_09950 [Xanthobacter autotrophicus DSM 431]|uniref:hypothetical protein n=1 Tax=Xanthobacter nonsaccharivorans TaxID=3119912 RepID=UPI003728EBBC